MSTKSLLKWGLGVAAALAFASPSFAAISMSGTGASAGNDFVKISPNGFCDPNEDGDRFENDGTQLELNPTNSNFNLPIGGGKLVVWKCKFGGQDLTFRYRSEGSIKGYTPLLATSGTDESKATQMLESVSPADCDAGTNIPNPFGAGVRTLYENCTTGVELVEADFGVSDVAGSSFGQVGPVGIAPFFPTDTVDPVSTAGLTVESVAVLPFSVWFGAQVGVEDASGNVKKAESISHLQLETTLAGLNDEWEQMGYVTGEHGGPKNAGPTTISRCHRQAGSGTKASVDQTLMKDVDENSSGFIPGFGPFFLGTWIDNRDGNFFMEGTSDVRRCLEGRDAGSLDAQGHAFGIGYGNGEHLEAKGSLTKDPGNTIDVQPVYVVDIDGFTIRDESRGCEAANLGNAAAIAACEASPPANGTDVKFDAGAKQDLRCGKYRFWVEERIARKDSLAGDKLSVWNDFVTQTKDQATLDQLVPTGDYWESTEDMSVFKTVDAGPVRFKAGQQDQCFPIDSLTFQAL